MRGEGGFSYIEVLIAMTLIAVCLVPAIEALQSGIRSSAPQSDYSRDRFGTQEKMEEVLSAPFSSLAAAALTAGGATVASSYSDLSGTVGRRLVFLAPYDGDNADGDSNPFSGGDDGLLWVRVATEDGGIGMETLTRR